MGKRISEPSRLTGGADNSARPDSSGKPEGVEIVVNNQGISNRSRWPVPWAFALLVITPVLGSGALMPYLHWFAGAGLLLLALWLGLFELHAGRSKG